MPYTAFVGGVVVKGTAGNEKIKQTVVVLQLPQRLRDLALERALESAGTHPKGQTPMWVKGNPEEPSPTWNFSK